MTSRRIALWAALSAVTFWTAKSVAIGIAGGLDKSPFEAPLFFLGLLSFVVAAVALGVAVTSGLSTVVRAAAGVGGFLLGFALTLLVDGAVGAFQPVGDQQHWVWSEVNLWVAGLTALSFAAVLGGSGRSRTAVA